MNNNSVCQYGRSISAVKLSSHYKSQSGLSVSSFVHETAAADATVADAIATDATATDATAADATTAVDATTASDATTAIDATTTVDATTASDDVTVDADNNFSLLKINHNLATSVNKLTFNHTHVQFNKILNHCQMVMSDSNVNADSAAKLKTHLLKLKEWLDILDRGDASGVRELLCCVLGKLNVFIATHDVATKIAKAIEPTI